MSGKLKILIEQQKNICAICLEPMNPYSILPIERGSREAPTIDHVIPLSKGGLDNKTNRLAVHKKCNLNKADKMPSSEYLARAKEWVGCRMYITDIAWGIVVGHGRGEIILPYSLRRTRSEAIKDECERYDGMDWWKLKRRGLRCIKIELKEIL
jgi:hypothetical protein